MAVWTLVGTPTRSSAPCYQSLGADEEHDRKGAVDCGISRDTWFTASQLANARVIVGNGFYQEQELQRSCGLARQV